MINTREDVKSAARGNHEQGTVKRREIWLMKQFSCRTYALNKPDAVASVTTKDTSLINSKPRVRLYSLLTGNNILENVNVTKCLWRK